MRTQLLGVASILGIAGTAFGQADFYLTVLHHNDGESQLVNAGSGIEDFGGIARFKTLADNLRANLLPAAAPGADKGVILISAGDNFLAGPEFNASITNGVPFYDAIGMDLIGYDAACIGNHEFDFGPDVLEDFISSFVGPVPFLSSNLDFTNEPGLQAQVNNGQIATSTVVTVQGRQIGIIGATTETLSYVSSPRNTIINQVLPAVQAEATALTNAGVDIIILTSHLQGIINELDLVASLSNIDIVVGGGGDELLASTGALLVPGDNPAMLSTGESGYPVLRTDSTGAMVPVVTTDGDYKYIGRLVVGFDVNGNIVEILSESDPVRVSGVAPDAVIPDPSVQAQVVDPVEASVASLAANVLGQSEVQLDGRRSEVRNRETNLGNLCADSMLAVGQALAGQFGVDAPQVALQNGGGIRNNTILPTGDITEFDSFSVLPFANFVSVVPNIPPAQFKEIMENAVSQVGQSGGRFAQIAGFEMDINQDGTAQIIDPNTGLITTPGNRVVNITLNDGTIVVQGGMVNQNAPDIDVATIDFLARGGDQYPFNGAAFTSLGVSYQQALANYITNDLSGVISTQDYPFGGEGRIESVCFADCNFDGMLNIFDYICFGNRYAAGSSYADCDGSGSLNVFDYICFGDAYAVGCP
ncbi:MAG: 5'-nucleotidase C-terminal domain-containing protein [Phycisphaeraceae bacterium]|nr:5'-nucleotidase C-terminal domain-containing protein [Phycisphaerales bacterium]MCB9859888.1 5'-nucleotidase C-terminal domain-containing protein [Phycisphaeraceae bacterium]